MKISPLQNRSENAKLLFWLYDVHVNAIGGDATVETTIKDVDSNTTINTNAIVDSITETMLNP